MRAEPKEKLICINCGHYLYDRSCKVRCERCGYFEDCSDGGNDHPNREVTEEVK